MQNCNENLRNFFDEILEKVSLEKCSFETIKKKLNLIDLNFEENDRQIRRLENQIEAQKTENK